MNVLTINVLSIVLRVKRLCHHEVVVVRSSRVEWGAMTDLMAAIFMMDTAEHPVLFAAVWVDGWSNARMGWMESKDASQICSLSIHYLSQHTPWKLQTPHRLASFLTEKPVDQRKMVLISLPVSESLGILTLQSCAARTHAHTCTACGYTKGSALHMLGSNGYMWK